jgi:DNA-binding MarR family transcriptional regulator
MKLKLFTPAQMKVYDAIMAHFAKTGSAPSLQAIADRLKYASLETVWKHVRALEKRGLIKKSPGGRIQVLTSNACPTCGHRKTA